MISRSLERGVAALCYVGALRVPLVALIIPQWAFAVPTGLLVTGLAWLYGQRSAFLLHHAREGFRWSLQANLLLVALTLMSKGLFFGWQLTGLGLLEALWRLMAIVVHWAGLLISLMTLIAMGKAARGETGDLFRLQRSPHA